MKKLIFLLAIALLHFYGFSQSTIIHVAQVFNGTSGSRAPNGTSTHTYLRGATIAKASELLTGMPSTTSIKSFGFTFNSGASTAVTGTLKIYLLNTSDSTYLKGTDWATVSGSMTQVYNGSFTIPAGTTTISSVDVNLTTPFSYTGGGLYVAYDWYSAGPYATTGAIYQCNNSIAGGVTMATSTSAAPTTIATSSAFRPIMRFGYSNPYTTDASVLQVYTLGKMPLPFGTPHAIQAYIKNQGSDTLFGLVSTLNITGANTFTDTKACNIRKFFPHINGK